MNSIPKYLIIIFIAAVVFVAGRYSKPDQDKELVRKYELERKYHEGKIKELNAIVANLDKAGQAISELRYQDSVKFAEQHRADKAEINKLKRDYEKINLSRASVVQLDSIRAGLPPLHFFE